MIPKFELLDDITMADVAFRAYGNDPGHLFYSSSIALLSVMLEDYTSISYVIKKSYEGKNRELDMLLFDFLNEILFYKDSELLVLMPDSISIEKVGTEYMLYCGLSGEKIDLNRHVFQVDIKAVTMHRLDVELINNVWTSTVVLDV